MEWNEGYFKGAREEERESITNTIVSFNPIITIWNKIWMKIITFPFSFLQRSLFNSYQVKVLLVAMK